MAFAAVTGMSRAGEFRYYYIEAENHQKSAGAGFRDEGFTYWMGHPSDGRTVIFGPGHAYVQYNLSRMPDGEYSLFIRHLATASVEADVNGVSLGATKFSAFDTQLAWCDKLKPFQKRGKTILTLKLAAGFRQAPYIDVLLLTNDKNFVPDNMDQNFKTATIVDDGSKMLFTDFQLTRIAGQTSASLSVKNNSSIARSVVTKISGIDMATKESFTARKTFAIQPGDNSVSVAFAAAANRRYVVTVDLSDDKNRLLFRKIAGCETIDPVDVKWGETYFSKGESLRVALRLNDPKLLDRHPAIELSIGKPECETASIRKRITMTEVEGGITTPLDMLDLGNYRARVKFTDAENPLGEFTLSKINWPREKLEDIKEVTVSDRVLLVNGKPFVPRTLAHAAGTRAVKAQGFNCVYCWGGAASLEKMLNEAHKNNLYGHATLYDKEFFKGYDKGFDCEKLAKVVERLKKHPALLSYETFDEPNAANDALPVQYLQEIYNLIQKLDPHHPVLLNFTGQNELRQYAKPADVVSVDCYPVPGPLTQVAEFLDGLNVAVDSRKPLQIILQAYGGPKGRMPTPTELRCMTYLAINHDARLFSFFTYAMNDVNSFYLARDPLLWSFMRQLNNELIALNEAIIVAAAPCVSTSLTSIDLSARQVGEMLFVFAVNKENKQTTATMVIKNAEQLKSVAVEFEDRQLKLLSRGKGFAAIVDSFQPYEVHVYTVK